MRLQEATVWGLQWHRYLRLDQRRTITKISTSRSAQVTYDSMALETRNCHVMMLLPFPIPILAGWKRSSVVLAKQSTVQNRAHSRDSLICREIGESDPFSHPCILGLCWKIFLICSFCDNRFTKIPLACVSKKKEDMDILSFIALPSFSKKQTWIITEQ